MELAAKIFGAARSGISADPGSDIRNWLPHIQVQTGMAPLFGKHIVRSAQKCWHECCCDGVGAREYLDGRGSR
jgi:hypothetical protein